MDAAKKAIFQQLQQDILRLHGFKEAPLTNTDDLGLGPMLNAFPNKQFPLAAIHELICPEEEDTAATGGFVSALLAALMRQGGTVLWISTSRKVFPAALAQFGIEPDRIIFIDLQKERDILWAMEEALKCQGLAAVVGETRELGFTASRRLQLAVEESKVPGFILRHKARNLNTNACVSRWRISPLPSTLEDAMPGIGYPRWKVVLEKVRNGKPGQWDIAWISGRFLHGSGNILQLPLEQKKKTG